jgi:hypothetical protein
MAPLDLSPEGLELMEAIEQCPASLPLSALPLDWPPARVAAVARQLLAQRVLLLQPGAEPAA